MTVGNIIHVPTIATLQALGHASAQVSAVYVDGYYTDGDGGEGVFVWNGASTATADGGTIFAASGVSTGRWFRQYAGPVNPNWFGAVVGVADCAVGVNAAWALGKDVCWPGPGPYTCSVEPINLTAPSPATQPAHTFFSSGPLCVVNFNFASAMIGLKTTGSGGEYPGGGQRILGFFFKGVANCSKVISVQAPNVFIGGGCVVVNAGGHCIYDEDEVAMSDIFGFGLTVDPSVIIIGDTVSGHYGIRTGLNAQASNLSPKSITLCGTGIAIQGACEAVVIKPQIVESCTDYAIDLNKAAATPLMAAITIEEVYCEACPVFVHAAGAEFHDISIRKNRYSAPAGGILYWGDTGALATSNNIFVEENDMDGGSTSGTVFQLDGPYTSSIAGAKGNITSNTSNYALGTYANRAYTTRVINGFFGSVVTGTLLTNDVVRIEAKSATVAVQMDWDSNEYLETITAPVVASGTGTNITVELHSVTLGGNTDAIVLTGNRSTTGNIVLSFNGYPDPTVSYYLLATWDNTDTSAILYPYQIHLRQ